MSDNITIEIYDNIDSGRPLVPTVQEGSTIDLSQNATWVEDSNLMSPLSGALITISGLVADALPMAVAIVLHESETEPNIELGNFSLVAPAIGEYKATAPATLNEIMFTHYGGGKVRLTYIQPPSITLDADDIDDSATTKKFTDAAGLAIIAATSGTNSGDQDLSGLAAKGQTDWITGFWEAPSDKAYKLTVKAPYGGTITETTSVCVSGTCTATFSINATPLGGTANAVSSTEQSQAHASANVFVAGDDINVTISSNTSCFAMALGINFTFNLV